MPGLARKLIIVAAVDGLLLYPSAHRNQRSGLGIRIRYATNEITSLGASPIDHGKSSSSFEAHGIVGIFTVASSSYLISIANREQVAQIRGKPIFVITDVTLIPLSSCADAKKVIEQTKESLKKSPDVSKGGAADSDMSEDEDEHLGYESDAFPEHDDPTVPPTPVAKGKSDLAPDQNSSSVVQDVFNKRGQYGRFAEKWFSKKGWSVEKRRMQGMSQDGTLKGESTASIDSKASGPEGEIDPFASSEGVSKNIQDQQRVVEKNSQEASPNVAASLLPKLLRTTRMLFGSRSFYFSYDHDITRRLGNQESSLTNTPLHKTVDPLFFWNRHLASALIDVGQYSFVLPVMQGFVGQKAFTVNTESQNPDQVIAAVKESPGEVIELQENASQAKDFHPSAKTRDFLITLISRRSIERPGLRYLRRGIDSEGHTANGVETEQILSDPSWAASTNIHSFVQIRGSIPLYFSQSPYSLKPVPVLHQSYETNHVAFQRHFKSIIDRYGHIQIVMLVDKHGTEAAIGEEYAKHTTNLNNEGGIKGEKLGWEWFDFHNICRGMKFENVSILMDSIGSTMDTYGETIIKDGQIQIQQSGILRTNCMDCLDRTNVVQSACGQRALEGQLKSEGISLNIQGDASTSWFNTLWADNGDAISKQYSSTAALKGDYTRTRKRDYRGALNDFGLTMSRYFNNIVNDYFSQAAIDYLLGKVTDQVFEEFEANMMSGDPAMSMRKVRQQAIDTSSKIVIEDQTEELQGGWTLLCPKEANTVRTFPFEETVLLLTDAALYNVRFDWNMEKVSSFERVDLRSIISITHGTYITSTLVTAQTDEKRNVGFVVKFRPGKEDIARRNTRSLSTSVPPEEESSDAQIASEIQAEAEATAKAETKPATPTPVSPSLAESSSSPSTALSALTSKVSLLATSSTSPKISKPPPPDPDLKLLAFKALPSRSSLASAASNRDDGSHPVSEADLVRLICEDVRRGVEGGVGSGGEGFLLEEAIISLAEAKKRAGLLEQWGHSLKRLVWA